MTNTPDAPLSKQKRVLLIRNAASYDFGGAERFIVNLATELQHLGWEPTIASAHTQIGKHAVDASIPFVKSPWLQSWQDWSGWRIALFPLYVCWQLYLIRFYVKLCKQLQPDAIHPQSRDDFIAATIVGRRRGIPVIWTDHADLKYVYQNVPVPIKNPIGKWVRDVSYNANAITLVSESEKELVAEALHTDPDDLPTQYRVVYNGVTDTPVIPVTRGAADRDAIIFCATSRMVTAKGIGELIDAFISLEEHLDARLWLVGDGPEIERFKQQANGHPHIVFMGFQSDVHAILAAADIFVHPSYHEGFSISIVEAARLGKPMIACDVGGNSEIVFPQRNGLLVTRQDTDMLAEAMVTLATNAALRQQYGAAARKTYESQFEFDRIVKERFIPLYEQ